MKRIEIDIKTFLIFKDSPYCFAWLFPIKVKMVNILGIDYNIIGELQNLFWYD